MHSVFLTTFESATSIQTEKRENVKIRACVCVCARATIGHTPRTSRTNVDENESEKKPQVEALSVK